MVEIEGLQLIVWDLMLVTEGVNTWKIKGYNLTIETEGEGLQLNGCH